MMLTLNDGRSELWQWDTGRTLAVDADCSQVHFSNKVFGRSIDVDVIDGAAIIPDVLLQTDNDLNVWAFVGTAENGYTKISKTFKVNRRNKPADYVFTPTEQTTIAELVEQIGNLDDLTTKAKDNLVAAINEAAKTGSGEGGTSDHSKLNNRNADDQHPMSAITGLVGALNGKMDSNNPVGTGSFSMGRKSNSIVGKNSHAEGDSTIASGPFSHAEGNSTTASGYHSHAEGHSTIASGSSSHAEGNSTTASSGSSHAEGYGSQASGDYSHAEGHDTKASGTNSHAEGHSTIASCDASHAQGKYNIKDSSYLYAHIVGNGQDDNFRSNAHTLDWSGNAWYAGDVFVGSASGTNKDDGSKKLATEEYVNNEIADCIKAPATASVGQTIVVKAVDETGKPTEWEAADMDGGEKAWKYEKYVEFSEETAGFEFTAYDDGTPFDFTEVEISAALKNAATGGAWGDVTVISDGIVAGNKNATIGGTNSSVSVNTASGKWYFCYLRGHIDAKNKSIEAMTCVDANIIYVNSEFILRRGPVFQKPNFCYSVNAEQNHWDTPPTKFTTINSGMTIGAGSSILIRGR